MSYTRDDFEIWIFMISDKMEYFTNEFAKKNNLLLDYSIGSLDFLENWLITKYDTAEQMRNDTSQCSGSYNLLDLCGIYVGQVFRKNIGGKWHMIMDNPKHAYYMLPVLTDKAYKGTVYKAPILLASACISRKKGTYISTVLKNNMRLMGEI